MNRNFMKSYFGSAIETDQSNNIPQPPLEKPYDKDADLISLPESEDLKIKKDNIVDITLDRKSNRVFKKDKITLKELSYLLTMTQRIKEIRGNNYVGLRPVPSAGGRHPFETYLAVLNVENLKNGIYRYLPLEHKLLFVKKDPNLKELITRGANNQKFAGNSGVTFLWTCIPYRTEWRYGDRAYKIMLLDAGHIGQALYSACESIGLGTCAIASYDQELLDNLLEIDEEEEFTVYIAPVGRI